MPMTNPLPASGATAWYDWATEVHGKANTIETVVEARVQQVIGAAPGVLDTLDELSQALGDDANFAATMTTALAAKAPTASPTFTGTVSGVTKAHVGLGNVNNTADVDKPISTAVQTALNGKVSTAGTPQIVAHAGGADPARPNTTRPVIWVVPDANRPAVNGTTAGGDYAAVDNLDYIWTF